MTHKRKKPASPVVIDIECDTAANYRWMRSLACQGHGATINAEGSFLVHDMDKFLLALKAANGRILEK